MSRTIILVVALSGIGGLLIGWVVSGSRSAPAHEQLHHALKRTAALSDAIDVRHEFQLLPADMHADRETPAVTADDHGRVVLAWASQTGESERTLYLARSEDGGTTFDRPVAWRKVPIYRFASRSKNQEMVFSTHVLPRLVAGREAIYLGWVEAIEGGPAVAYFVSKSLDGGRTFSAPIRVHGDEAVKPGFTALAVGPDDSVECAWLDGRGEGQQPFASRWPKDSEGFEPERLIFAGPDGKGVCPCCDLAVVRSEDGTEFVAFRNNDEGYRDIWLASVQADNQASPEPPTPVSTEHWSFNGCPHDGPALLARDGRLSVIWMDAHTGKNRVYFADSLLEALDFHPREVSPGTIRDQSHPKLSSDCSGKLYAVWDESLGGDPEVSKSEHAEHGHSTALTGSGRAVMFAVSKTGDFSIPVAIDPRPGAFQIQPCVASSPDGNLYVAWNEIDADGKRVVFSRVSNTVKER
jgi:hypothetical protein